MDRNVFKDARKSVYILALIMVFVLLFYVVASMFTSVGYQGFRRSRLTATTALRNYTFIIDAGHGGEDPGAVVDGVLEKEINLSVATKLNEIMTSFGYNVVLTRTEDVLLYKNGQEKQKKFYDLRNRAKIAERYQDGIFISIHMNKFPSESCKGFQTFYSDNNELSKPLAELVQSNSRYLQTYNKRTVKSGNDTIYLLEHMDIPAILIECGFLSNPDELMNLSDNEYQTAIAFGIFCAIAEFTENNQ